MKAAGSKQSGVATKNRRPGRYLIYGLLDPESKTLRYVGKTHKRREIRLAEHIRDAEEGSKLHVHNWIRGVLKSGNKPTIFVLDRIPATADWAEAEIRHIRYWKTLPEAFLPMRYPAMTKGSETVDIYGIALTNMTEGG
jgi:hypothetical protein